VSPLTREPSEQTWNRNGRSAGNRLDPVQIFRPTGFHRFLPVFFLNFFGEIKLAYLSGFLTISIVSIVKKYDPESFPLTKPQSYSKAQVLILSNTSYPTISVPYRFEWIYLYSRKFSQILQINVGLNSKFFTVKFLAHSYAVILADFHRNPIPISTQFKLS
jgi:hypothetical protein